MKKNSLIIILFIIIFLLISYIVFDKLNINTYKSDTSNEIKVIDNIKLSYVNIYLCNDYYAYISPINKEEINNLDLKNNLKDRLNTLYERAFYYDIYINNNKLKGFRVKLNSDIKSIREININDSIYIIFIKDNNTIGLFNYEDYYNLLDTNVIDNYNNINNVKDITNNKIIYLDGSSEEFKMK